jgi:mannose-6-phosphate isomerase-like protein (cupin superfamily)
MPDHSIKTLLEDFVAKPTETPVPPELTSQGIDLLPAISDYLRADADIDKTEAVERVLKSILMELFQGPLKGRTCRQIALFQNSYRFAYKYKSYAVKAATPLGYSIFLQEPAEGFSFQRHVTHKTEVFHILDTKPGALVFLCEFEDWQRHYEPQGFQKWLGGGVKDDFYDQHTFRPRSGDVFIISELGVVHTVMGCILEEFATVSTDMVMRLHDQNKGFPIPSHFTRQNAEREMLGLSLPKESRLVDRHTWKSEPIPRVRCEGGFETILTDSFVRASRREVEVGAQTELRQCRGVASIIRVFSGSGTLWVLDDSEVGNPEQGAIVTSAGDVFLLAPGTWFGFKNEARETLRYSEQQIPPEVAFV